MNQLIMSMISRGLVCPYCMRKSEYINSAEVYGTDYGNLYICRPCKAWVGVHHGTSRVALGRLANEELRKLKRLAHKNFDQLWKKKVANGMSQYEARTLGYRWLSGQMGTPIELTHIGMFDEKQCKKVIQICEKYL